jgi:hypothetical protein
LSGTVACSDDDGVESHTDGPYSGETETVKAMVFATGDGSSGRAQGNRSSRRRRAAGSGDLMSTWMREELDTIGAADEVDIAARRPDGTLRPYATIWVVRVGDRLYVRSYLGHDGSASTPPERGSGTNTGRTAITETTSSALADHPSRARPDESN